MLRPLPESVPLPALAGICTQVYGIALKKAVAFVWPAALLLQRRIIQKAVPAKTLGKCICFLYATLQYKMITLALKLRNFMINRLRLPILLVALSTLLFSCSEEAQRGMKAVPTAFGQLNEIVVIMDQDLWESRVGDTIRYYYSSAYPLLPQPEPVFDLRHFTPTDLKKDPLRRELRTYMLVGDLSDEDSPTSKMIRRDIGAEKARRAKDDPSVNNAAGRDKWAKGQLLLYQFAYSNEALIKVLKENYPAIKKKVNKFDEKKLESYIYLDGVDNQLIKELKDSLGISMRIPNDYFVAINEGDFVWLRKETDKTSQNLMVKKMKYEEEDQLSKEYLLNLRDSLGKEYVSSTIEGSYMRVNREDLPIIYNTTRVSGHYAVEARGIWEIVDDYMGGAFISYLVLNANTNELLFIDGFLHAPGEEKRDLMEHLDYIIHTLKFK